MRLTVVGCSGSTPLAAVIGAPTATSGLPGRKPAFRAVRWLAGRCTKSTNRFAALRCAALTQGASRT